MTAREPTVFLMSGSTFQVKVMLDYNFFGFGSRMKKKKNWRLWLWWRSRWRRIKKEEWD